MHRVLEPEILDTLPFDHPAALHNRRDLRLTNLIAGSHRWISRTLRRHLRPGETLLEIGAGTGELGRRLHRLGLAADGLDLWPRPGDWPAERAWHVGDLRAFGGYDRYEAICGNLIFHQFAEGDLRVLGEHLRRRARLIIACEPARRRISQVLYRLIAPLLGANYVTLHDAHVSIAAGFRGRELPDALGLDEREWSIRCQPSLLGLYRMLAVRREKP